MGCVVDMNIPDQIYWSRIRQDMKTYAFSRIVNVGKDIVMHKCIECKHCDEKQKKCYPESRDCLPEYNLTDEDMYEYSDKRCDFFERK